MLLLWHFYMFLMVIIYQKNIIGNIEFFLNFLSIFFKEVKIEKKLKNNIWIHIKKKTKKIKN